jgi:hypothetical protein
VPDLQIRCVNPLEHARQIKELFVANERPDFPEFFDRAYPSAVRSGGKSWIGVDSEGQIVMHIALFPHRFVLGERTVTGGLLVNLMAAKTHRTVVPALTLMRRVTEDSKVDRANDFLYADPNPAGSALLKAAGFSPAGTFQRFALPLANQRWYSDVAARMYLALVRIRAWKHRAKAVEHPAEHFDATAFERPTGNGGALRPLRPRELYCQRLIGYPSSTDYWFTFHRNAHSAQPAAAVLVRGGPDHIAAVCTVARDPSFPLPAIVPRLASALRRAGYHRLFVSTLAGTRFAGELTRAGFLPRDDRTPFMVRALTELGEEATRSTENWELTELDCDR